MCLPQAPIGRLNMQAMYLPVPNIYLEKQEFLFPTLNLPLKSLNLFPSRIPILHVSFGNVLFFFIELQTIKIFSNSQWGWSTPRQHTPHNNRDSFTDVLVWSPEAGVRFFKYIPWTNCVDLGRPVSWASVFLKDWGGLRERTYHKRRECGTGESCLVRKP